MTHRFGFWQPAAVLAAALLIVQPATAVADPASDYAALIKQANLGDPATDFTAMRMYYAQLADYDPYGKKTDALMDAGALAYMAKNCKAAMKSFRAAIALNFTIADAHAFGAECLKQSGDQAGGQREVAIARGLLHSILISGDGRSVKTAFRVVHIYEEQLVLKLANLREARQSLLNAQRDAVDKIDVVDLKGVKKGDIYFNVSLLLAGTERQIRARSNR